MLLVSNAYSGELGQRARMLLEASDALGDRGVLHSTSLPSQDAMLSLHHFFLFLSLSCMYIQPLSRSNRRSVTGGVTSLRLRNSVCALGHGM